MEIFGDHRAHLTIEKIVRRGRGVDAELQLDAEEVNQILAPCVGVFSIDPAVVELRKRALPHCRSMAEGEALWIDLETQLGGYRTAAGEEWQPAVGQHIQWSNPVVDARWHREIEGLPALAECTQTLLHRAYELADEIEETTEHLR